MNLKMIGPKNQIEDLLLSFIKTCGTLIKQNHKKFSRSIRFQAYPTKRKISFQPTYFDS